MKNTHSLFSVDWCVSQHGLDLHCLLKSDEHLFIRAQLDLNARRNKQSHV